MIGGQQIHEGPTVGVGRITVPRGAADDQRQAGSPRKFLPRVATLEDESPGALIQSRGALGHRRGGGGEHRRPVAELVHRLDPVVPGTVRSRL